MNTLDNTLNFRIDKLLDKALVKALHKVIGTGFLLHVLLLGVLVSCTDEFDEINRTGEGIVTADIKKIDQNATKVYFPEMMKFYKAEENWIYQRTDVLGADAYGGYLSTNTDYNQNNNLTGRMVDEWNLRRWESGYKYTMPNWLNVQQSYTEDSKHIYGAALIWKVLSMQRVVDAFGPIPYSQFGSGGFTSAYDSEEQIYQQFINELDTARIALKEYVAKFPESKPLAQQDLVFKGEYQKWIRLANSIQLRIAMRVVKVRPDLARKWAEEVFAENDFLTDDVEYDNPLTNHPLIGLAFDFKEINMSANMESYLVGYQDPRLPKMFSRSNVKQRTEGDNVQPLGTYVGIRTAIASSAEQKNIRAQVSTLGGKYQVSNIKATPIEVFNVAEVFFNKAEAALRGWSAGGTAQEFYEEGVRQSFKHWEAAGVETYLDNQGNVPKNHLDAVTADLDIEPLSSLPVKWKEDAGNEEKLERIMIQKWIANFPNGTEAWADYRRTGYPKLFPMHLNQSEGEVDSNLGVRRLSYLTSEVNNNATAVSKAIQLLKAKTNSPGSRLWWDVEGPNF